MNLVSIVVPVYKVESYLHRCVDSLLGQTFPDFDIVLVDDGSPDDCPRLCDEIAASDGRVHVIHQDNRGLSAARNAGIEWALRHSDSEWVTFIDSDDWVHPQFLEANLKCADQFGVSICMSRFLVTSDYTDSFDPVQDADLRVYDTTDAFQTEALDSNSACGRLFKKSLFEQIRFPLGKLHEDRFTTYKVLFQFRQVGVIEKPLYFYYVNPEGIVHSEWTPRRMDDVEATEQQLAYFKEHNLTDVYRCTVRDYHHILVYFLRYLKTHSEYRKYERLVRRKLRRSLHTEKCELGLSFRNDYQTYKYAYPFAAKVYRRLQMR